MPSFELNRLQSITGISPTSAADRAKAKPSADALLPDAGTPSAGSPANGSASASGVAVEIAASATTAAAASSPPVDTDRVAQIRSALRDGTYPLVPAKIADAMIAAQLKFEVE